MNEVGIVGLGGDWSPSIVIREEVDTQGEVFRLVMRVRLGC